MSNSLFTIELLDSCYMTQKEVEIVATNVCPKCERTGLKYKEYTIPNFEGTGVHCTTAYYCCKCESWYLIKLDTIYDEVL